jgi:hypothetical protein
MARMLTNPVSDMPVRLLRNLAAIDHFRVKLRDQHPVLADILSGSHVGDVLDEEIAVADLQVEAAIPQLQEIRAMID